MEEFDPCVLHNEGCNKGGQHVETCNVDFYTTPDGVSKMSLHIQCAASCLQFENKWPEHRILCSFVASYTQCNKTSHYFQLWFSMWLKPQRIGNP